MRKIQKSEQFKLHIVNSDYGLASYHLCELPDSCVPRYIRNSNDLMHTLFIYMKENDMIVLNEDNILSHAFGELLVELLPLSDSEKGNEIVKIQEVSPDYFEKIVTVIGIQEYRRIMGYSTGTRK